MGVWIKRSFCLRDGYAQFDIIQGGIYEELREQSAKDLIELNFEGYAVGGLAVREGQELMFKVLDYSTDFLPHNKPRYLMGVGKPLDIIGAVRRGIDMFDCIIPTRSGRNGQAFTKYGTVNIRNSKYADDNEPLAFDCSFPACKNYSKAYLHPLVEIGEILGSMLMTWHNLTYFQNLMSRIREPQDALLFSKLNFVYLTLIYLFIIMQKFAKPIKLDKNSSSVKETVYLLISPENAERLKRAINDFEANKNFKAVSLQKFK